MEKDKEGAAESKEVESDEGSDIGLYDVQFTDHKVTEIINSLIKKTPEPSEELNSDIYKLLVKNFSNDFKKAQTNPVDAEVTAKKLAAWILSYDKTLKQQESKDESEEDNASHSNDSTPESEDYDTNDGAPSQNNVTLFSLSSYETQPYWHEDGKVYEFQDKIGSKIFVKGLVEGGKKKTLVKKTSKGNEVSSWIVEVAEREIKSDEDSFSNLLEQNVPTNILESPTAGKWKNIADIEREETTVWKNRSESEDLSEDWKIHQSIPGTRVSLSSRDTPITYSKKSKTTSGISITTNSQCRFNNAIKNNSYSKSDAKKSPQSATVTPCKKPSTTPSMYIVKRPECKLQTKTPNSKYKFLDVQVDGSGRPSAELSQRFYSSR